jgi:hypothetical protein
MINRTPVVITSVTPLQGHEGTVVTLKGSGFAPHIRNNCIVIGGMGACARAEPKSTDTTLKVRIGPVARATQGDLLMWPGTGADLHTESLSFGETSLRFSETAVFRNGAPVASARINFKLTKASPNTYAGYFEKSTNARVRLGGLESGSVMRASFPKDFSLPKQATVDVCIVLKEPTLAIDFSAAISGRVNDAEDTLRVIAETIKANANLIGERVFADVVRNQETGELELYVTKPYLENGMFTVRFNSGRSRSTAS